MKTIWFDIGNTPHVNFFKPFINHLSEDYSLIFSLKEFAEVRTHFEREIGQDYIMVGEHKGGSKIKKVYGVFERTIQLLKRMEKFDIKISIGGDSSNLCAKLRGKKSITFDDNETAPNWRYSQFTDFAFWPSAIPLKTITSQGFRKNKVYRYNGFKEDIYIADYSPDPSFMDNIPFSNYVVVRPENILANYVDSSRTIVPDLIKKLVAKGYNVLYLPRYKHDFELIEQSDKIYIPPHPLNGLDICYHADAVLTGAGTIAREAVCLGTPAVSFFAGSRLLMVDQELIKQGKMVHTRNPDEIIEHALRSKKGEYNPVNSKQVRGEVFEKLDEVLRGF